MINLAIIGAESSHAWSFAKMLAGKNGEKLFEDVELLGVYADTESEDGRYGAAKVEEVSCCSRFEYDYNNFLSDADAVMITSRHGDTHLKFAEQYIKKGIPVWIDKPITCCSKDVCEMIASVKKHNCLIAGGSGLVYVEKIKELSSAMANDAENIAGGHVTAPLNMENSYGGFWFYTQHLVQMITALFGNEVKSVYASLNKNTVSAVYSYENFDVTACYGTDYSVSIYKKNGSMIHEKINLGEDFYEKELRAFYNCIKSNSQDMTCREFSMPVFILEATIKSFSEKRIVEIINPIE